MFRLQSNVPIPKTIRPSARGRRKYPLEQMKIGDMFFVPEKTVPQLSGYLLPEAKKLGIKLTSRLTYAKLDKGTWSLCDEDDKGASLGVGVWRVE